MPPDIVLSPIEDSHLPGVLAIQNHEIATGVALWNETLSTLEDVRAWRADRLALGYPMLAALRGEAVVGYGALGPFRPHQAYAATVEHSVYVAEEEKRHGVGRALLRALIAEARAQGRHAIVGGIEAGNEPSLALHRAEGFEETARMPEVGYKFGRRLTLVFMQKLLRA
ncbi:MAG: N-acetyltransferase family protein [Pseudomonadota bacterium]